MYIYDISRLRVNSIFTSTPVFFSLGFVIGILCAFLIQRVQDAVPHPVIKCLKKPLII